MKKIISLFVWCSIMASLCVPIVASDSGLVAGNYDMEAAIETDRQRMYDDLVAQLEAQDAIDMLDYFLFLIDDTIQAKYFPAVQSASSDEYYAPDGGWYIATSSYVDMEAQFLDTHQTMVAKANRDSGLNKLITALAGVGLDALTVVGGMGTILTIYGIGSACLDWMQWDDIEDGDRIFIISSYDKLDLKTVTVVWEWINYPYMTMDDSYMTIVDYGIN